MFHSTLCFAAGNVALSNGVRARSHWEGIFESHGTVDPDWATQIKAHGPQLYKDLHSGAFQQAYGQAAGLTQQQWHIKSAVERCVAWAR